MVTDVADAYAVVDSIIAFAAIAIVLGNRIKDIVIDKMYTIASIDIHVIIVVVVIRIIMDEIIHVDVGVVEWGDIRLGHRDYRESEGARVRAGNVVFPREVVTKRIKR